MEEQPYSSAPEQQTYYAEAEVPEKKSRTGLIIGIVVAVLLWSACADRVGTSAQADVRRGSALKADSRSTWWGLWPVVGAGRRPAQRAQGG